MTPIAFNCSFRYAVVSGVPIFLDIASDRYFALPADAAAAFLDLVGGSSSLGGVKQLLAAALSIADADEIQISKVESTRLILPTHDTQHDDEIASTPLQTARAIIAIITARCRMTFFGMNGGLHYVQKCRSIEVACASNARTRIAHAHRSADRWLSAFADCLTRAIALSAALSRAGVVNDLIIGVKALPFGAHSWVQIGECVVNDRVERVLPFTPIVIL